MTTLNAIQQNIHYYKMELARARKAVCIDNIEKMNIEASINYYLEQLNDLKISLSFEIKK